MLHMNLMVTINQKLTIDTQKINRKPNLTLQKAIKPQREESKGRKNREKLQKQPENNKRAGKTYLSTITVNINRLNVPIKRHRVTEWIRKQHPSICCLSNIHFRPKDRD